MHNILFHSRLRASPQRHITLHGIFWSDGGTNFLRGASFRKRGKYKYKQANMHSSILFWTSFNVTASNFPIGCQSAAHRLHKEFAKAGGARLPWAPIKTSFGKVAAFHPSVSKCFFSPLTTSLYKLQKSNSESRLLETKSKVREEGEDKLGQEDGKSKKAISHALVRKLWNNFKC